ncbi:disease resistance protein RGA5-like [Panicum virgatum]|uniref:Uncharacterized protein n=1 Tax=Panicum virgatum TaxID=38727 RepID=A0A8T0V704_PANVG|nr:disease resistance protein RGA5-like [Panicum virgatum]XP_039839985.1 disease resistance protein RGA5-like [Panicum virgatum]KAG2630336.1 hypothetical protein PVAP13_3KG484003 [Panicum virgatum]KAG2630338.1 hypothetical protein PVAP13_3KG484003 [Panicum virgatum]
MFVALAPPPSTANHSLLHGCNELMAVATVSAFSGAMGSVLAKLAALLADDFKLAKGAKKDIVSLRDEMSTINASLMVLSEMEEPMDAPHRELRDKVRELAYDMEDCLDVSMHRLGDASGKAGLLGELKTLGARYKIATLIRALTDRVAALGDRRKLVLQLPERPPSRAVRVDPRIQALYADAANLQGIGGPREKLVELLQDGTPQLKVVSIVGFGGIGKTTLANQVYTTIQGKYDLKAFVSVSRTPNLAKILSDIERQFFGYYCDSSQDESELIDSLRMWLEDQRYLIVIDDIWDIEAWNILKNCFIDNNRGSRVITTTRAEDTAKECCSSSHDCVYRIKPLSDVASRRLFYRRIFHSEDACPEQLKCISNDILKKCGGLPLAILTIGSMLARQQEVRSMEIWEKIMHSFRFHLETSPAFDWMRHVFNLGYNDLSLDLKTCMLYLGIFAEEDKILKADLLRRWIAEGFITERHGDCQEEIAESYINELINRNMIQIAEFDDCGDVFSVRMHDLLLEYIILKSTEENFITYINDDKHSTKGSFEVRRLSVQVRNSESCAVLENMALTQARSFNLWSPAQWLPSLKKFRLLRVLHLDIFGSKDRQYDMSSVSSLFQLRYLRIRGILCEKLLGTQLRNLEQLRTLDVSGEFGGYFTLDARMLPSTLQHLNLEKGVWLKGGIGRLRDLRTLCEFEIDLGDEGRMKELGELTNLRELKLYRYRSGSGDTTCDVLLSSLCRLCKLRSLIIRGPIHVDPDFLTRWSPPPRHLRRLHLLACPFSTVPADLLAQLGSLSSLEIRVLSLPSDGADVLARLTSLVHMTLHVHNSPPQEGIVVLRRAAFPNLRKLSFRCEAPCLAFEQGTMPRLRSLVVECYERGTRHTDGVLDGIEHLGSLDELKVSVFQREDFRSRYGCHAQVGRTEMVRHRKWDGRSLEAALKEAISKHPGTAGGLRVVIEEA